MSNLKRFLALTLAMLMVVGAMVTVSAKSFEDVAATDSYAEAVDVLSELGVIAGTSADEFSPDTLVERQQMAMFIARLATAQPALFAGSAGAVFADQTAPVYNAAIAYASSNGFVKGTSATTFNGAASVTLQEAATMLSRVLGYGNKTNDATYPYSYMVLANEIGLLAGLEDVAPTAALTRGEVATMLYNALFAPKAERELLYTPDGQDWVVSVPATFYGPVTVGTVTYPKGSFDSLITKTWKATVVEGAYINATLKAGIGEDPTSATKAIKDPVTMNKQFTKAFSFATLGKYFEEDVTADDMLGVELKMIVRNGAILKLDVVGSKSVTSSASYNKDTKVITVDGNAYNLAAYLGETYPADSDNCFYKFNGSNKIVRVTTDLDATYAQIANGFFTFEVINEGLASQMLVYKPESFNVLTDNDANGVLEVNGAVVTSNTTGAVKGDYVTYFNGGDKNVVVTAKAVKTTGNKVASISLTANKATMVDGTTAPAKAGTPINGASLIDLAIGSTYDVYAVNGVALKTALTAVDTKYVPKDYYKVLDTDIIAGGFNAYTYKVKVVNAAGTESIVDLTKVGATTLAYTTSTADKTAFADLIKGAVVTIKDGVAFMYAAASGDYFGDTTNDSVANQASVTFGKNVKIFTIESKSAVLADYSKVVIKGTDGYVTFSAKAFTGVEYALTGVQAVMHKNDVGINELVYLFATCAQTVAEIKGNAAITPDANLYLFVSVDSYTDTTVTYNAVKLSTGAKEQLVFTNAAADGGSAAILAVTNNKVGATSAIYNVQSGDKKPVITNDISVIFKRSASGYITTGNNIYTNNGTVYYKWNATTGTFDASSADAFTAATEYVGIISVTNGNASYVVERAASIASFVATGATGTPPIDTVTYAEYKLMYNGVKLDLDTTKLAKITVLKPSATAAVVLTINTDTTLWFNTTNVAGTYSYTMNMVNGQVYVATIVVPAA